MPHVTLASPLIALENSVTAAAFRQTPLFSRWRPIDAVRPAMSASWWQWVASTDSLTARLMAAGGAKPFRVRLLRQGVGWPRQDEAQALGIGAKRYAWLREVALCLDETPWVVARSVAPLAQLKGQRLDRLGERSLGSWLFRQPGLIRGSLEATTQVPTFASVNGIQGNAAWGRRSVFSYGCKHHSLSLLVQEYFLSAMADDLGLPSR
ncbi:MULTISPECIES: chorismate--pyruvate lyase family protein [unclassified Halomonas]|uniref:chorismate--pyruvate lyase family protein n=1 Tax=unclassified Halomonas TaxID=2609666 RepID=UPI001CF37BC0|nr:MULTISPECIES: chorismate lyase [unclassified Halomonas]MCA8864286.1 chorismate lyase [Halomonas sp. SBBP1]UZH10096.1 chorismate lyase [Halomonas sp. BDJS001]